MSELLNYRVFDLLAVKWLFLIGGWVVYKLQYFVWAREIGPPEKIGEYPTSDTARYKTEKYIREQGLPHSTTEHWVDNHGWYWLKKVGHGVINFIFVPVRVDSDGNPTKQ